MKNQKPLKKETLFKWGIALQIIGNTLVGYGIGKIFDNNCSGSIIGLGVGLTSSAMILFRVFRRLAAFEKNNPNETTGQ